MQMESGAGVEPRLSDMGCGRAKGCADHCPQRPPDTRVPRAPWKAFCSREESYPRCVDFTIRQRYRGKPQIRRFGPQAPEQHTARRGIARVRGHRRAAGTRCWEHTKQGSVSHSSRDPGARRPVCRQRRGWGAGPHRQVHRGGGAS